MPTRIASMKKRIVANGQALHRAMAARTGSGAAGKPSEEEAALIEERKQLKDEQAKRKAQALLPRKSALDRLVRTHHPEAKAGKVKKAHEAGETKKPKARRSRAEKHAEKAAAQEAARHTRSAAKKPAK